MGFLVRILISALAAMFTAYLLKPAVKVDSFVTALILALVLAVLNALVKPLLVVLTLPITFLTLGLFLLVINALIILLAEKLVPGFKVEGFWWAMLFSIIMAVVNYILSGIAGSN
ncbi:putative membrane protein [Chitinophaga terrae (ex Kim and Jung 2007)]|jgi:putative membrane protein|uniref:Putative membrane protein n=1 Tax=Chitinophaga terrae (ex Kim and Jung 2007) TaxID=408074 RepID=A0A1H4EC40_9BACT|nr:phage holin family protein [Chitinophaga terrae (ex Kim and Jung 2007)]MDQ0105505.1 putative membrane protein [Chitinophaga terrae (ex Kim and Jung 2007)]GEP91546.1 membrane protein [Chitinophaga terrae (ex Kim and Jung 2007)]SEA82516.1 putative membrane protein [Chitinophaga terrae (ex Kim and Jung 2007)]